MAAMSPALAHLTLLDLGVVALALALGALVGFTYALRRFAPAATRAKSPRDGRG